MAISLRLDSKHEMAIERIAHSEGKTKSELLRNLIIDFIDNKTTAQSPWDSGKNLFGKRGSGSGNLSVNRKKILKEKIRAQKGRH